MVTFRCKCGATLEVYDHLAGKSVRCYTCGHAADVPGVSLDGEPVESAPADAPREPTPSSAARPEHSVPLQVGEPADPATYFTKCASDVSRGGRNGLLILIGLIMLSTAYMPWLYRPRAPMGESRFIMSWELIRRAAESRRPGTVVGTFVAFLFASWAIGLFALLLGLSTSDTDMSVPRVVLGAVGLAMFLLMVITAMDVVAEAIERPFGAREIALGLLGLFSLLGLLIFSHVQLRIGGKGAVRFGQGLCALVVGGLTVVELIDLIPNFTETPETVEARAAVLQTLVLVHRLAVLLACGLALAATWVGRRRAGSLSMASLCLIYGPSAGLVVVMLYSFVKGTGAVPIVPMMVNLLLLLACHLLLLIGGAVGLLCERVPAD